MDNMYTLIKRIHVQRLIIAVLSITLSSCSTRKIKEEGEEQIQAQAIETPVTSNSAFSSIQSNVSFTQLASTPNSIILTGLPDYRLVSIYKSKYTDSNTVKINSGNAYSYNEEEGETVEHFMPGFDILCGYNLLNIAHYGMKTGKLSYLFNHPVLVKTLYYPCLEQDSIKNMPINRNYYLVSVYDEDCNKDGFINRFDLRRFYYVDGLNQVKLQLIPADYSVLRSQYDPLNDAMYIFAGHDENKNNKWEAKEPIHIFWIDLKNPVVAKRLY
jgi:hypothetical protein